MHADEGKTPASQPNLNSGQVYTWTGHMADDARATYGREPAATLSATTEELIVYGPLGNFRIPHSAVTKVGLGNLYPWLFAAVRIHHKLSGYPANLQFKPSSERARAVRAQLRSLGYR
jgi:hypothetical protein